MNGVYRELSLGELCDRLCERKSTLIIFHDRPDGDATGSAFALRELLISLGMPAYCVCADEVHSRYRFAVEGLQDSVLPLGIPSGFATERVVTVDTASLSQIKGLGGRFDGKIDLMIDHHARGEAYADRYLDSEAAAAGEIVFDISRELLARKAVTSLPERFSLLCYMAMATDTGCFKYSNTTPGTHRRTAELMDGTFDYAQTNFRLFDSKSPAELKVNAAALEGLTFYCGGSIAVVSLDYKKTAALGVPPEYLDLLIDVARSVEGVELAVSVRQPTPESCFRVSMRSTGAADVSEICASFGGGGHRRAAGCSIYADDINAAIRMIIDRAAPDLNNYTEVVP